MTTEIVWRVLKSGCNRTLHAYASKDTATPICGTRTCRHPSPDDLEDASPLGLEVMYRCKKCQEKIEEARDLTPEEERAMYAEMREVFAPGA